MGRPDVRVAGDAVVSPPRIVRQEDHDIGTPPLRGGRREGREGEQAQADGDFDEAADERASARRRDGRLTGQLFCHRSSPE